MFEENAKWNAIKNLMDQGVRVLQFFLFGKNEKEHITKLLGWMNPPEGAKILDVGCGIGEVARLMRAERKDLDFFLLNNCPLQLGQCPEGMSAICTDMKKTGMPDNEFDAVMVNYAIGYADIDELFNELRRILKPGGLLFICDVTGQNPLFPTVFDYNIDRPEVIVEAAAWRGFSLDMYISPEIVSTAQLDAVLKMEPKAAVCTQALAGVKPCVWRFTKNIPEKPWGIAASIDVYNCNPDTIRDADAIKQFVKELCELIGMRRFGDTTVVHFGEAEVAGYSMTQLIETSLISGHFANQSNTAYLDVFSCKPYDANLVREFSQIYFEGSYSIMNAQDRK